MDSAKKNTFTIEARKIISAGIAQRQADDLAGNVNKSITGSLTGSGANAYYCYTFAKVGIDNGGKYHGTLRFYPNQTDANKQWQIRMTDGSNQTDGWLTLSALNDASKVVAQTAVASDSSCA